MSTKFTFPRSPKVGDRLEIVSVSEDKLPIEIVGNPEAEKTLTLIFPWDTHSGSSDGETVIASINDLNTVYSFKCVGVLNGHVWLLENTAVYATLNDRISALEEALEAL